MTRAEQPGDVRDSRSSAEGQEAPVASTLTSRGASPWAPGGGGLWWVMLLAATLLTFLCYHNTLSAPFQYDDEVVILDRKLHDPLDVSAVAKFNPARFLVNWSFAWQWKIWQRSTFPYHLVNVLLHLACGVLVSLVLYELLQSPYAQRFPRDGILGWLPLFGALIFLAHPVQTQAVSYVVQRYVPASAFCYLAAVFCYMRGRRTAPHEYAILWMVGAGVAAALGLGCKEIIVTLPLALALIEGLFYGGFRRAVPVLGAFGSLGVMAVAIKLRGASSLSELSGGVMRILAPPSLPFDGLDYLRSEMYVLLRYLRLLILPYGQTLDHDVPIDVGETSTLSIISAVGVACVVGIAILCVFGSIWIQRARREEGPKASIGKKASEKGSDAPLLLRLIGFSILWFFATLALESSIIPIIDLCIEHRLYLAVLGLAVVIVCVARGVEMGARWLIGQDWERSDLARMALPIALAILVAFYAGLAHQRNIVWKSWVALWMDATRKSPAKAKAWHNLGTAFERHSQLPKALCCYSRAIQIFPNYSSAFANLGWVQSRLGQKARENGDEDRANEHFTLAVEACKRSVALDASSRAAWNFLGVAFARLRDHQAAEAAYQRALDIEFESPDVNNNMGSVLVDQGRHAEAIPYLERAIASSPGFLPALSNLGLAYHKSGFDGSAVVILERALGKRPKEARLRLLLAKVFKTMGQAEKAVEQLRECRRYEPENVVAAVSLGQVLIEQEAWDEAREALVAAAELSSSNPRIPFYLGVAWARQAKAAKSEGNPAAARDLHGEAIAVLRRAERLEREREPDPSRRDVSIWTELGTALSEVGDSEAAALAYSAATVAGSGRYDTWYNLGLAQATRAKWLLDQLSRLSDSAEQQRQFKEAKETAAAARESLTQATLRDSSHAEAYYNLGNVYYDFQRWLEAAEVFAVAVERDPDHAGARFNRAQALLIAATNRPGSPRGYVDPDLARQAVAELTEVLRLEPPERHPRRALIYVTLGDVFSAGPLADHHRASREYQSYLALIPEGDRRREAVEKKLSKLSLDDSDDSSSGRR